MKNSKLRYIAYVRKSEERKERQLLSHKAQIRKIKEQFPDINIVKWMPLESHSAFKPGRPVFDEMIKLIKEGKADGIVAYHPNRVSRNEIDAANITYMLRTGDLIDLKFCSYTFENNAEGIMMLQIIMSQSQYESSKQGRDVKRGMQEKAIDGERPGIVPQGYIKVPVTDGYGSLVKRKDKIVTKTEIDPDRYDLVKRMWAMLLAGKHTPRQIRNIANKDWGYTTRRTEKIGGGPIGLSSIYRIFNNPFYCGYIRHNDELYKGSHEPMITMEEFDIAQKILGDRGKPRNGVNSYAYSGLIKCGECGCSIVGKTNVKYLKRSQKMVAYVHYYCTRKSDVRPCTQSRYTRLEDIEKEIDAELAKYTILPEFRDLALKILNRNHKLEIHDRAKIYNIQQKKRQQLQQKLDNLVDMRTSNLLDDDEYRHQKDRLKSDLARLDEGLRSTEQRADDWLELTEKAFNFATYARVNFRNGNMETKRDILKTLGQNFKLKDQKLTLQQSDWLMPIEKEYPTIEAEYLRRVRTNKKATPKVKEMALASVSEKWRARWDLNPRHPA